MNNQRTIFGSLEHYDKGGVQIIDDDPKRYAFSNVFEVAAKSKPYEKVAVGKNLKYVIEALRAEGTSPWFAAAHDEAALVMDGEIEVHYVKPDQPVVAAGSSAAALPSSSTRELQRVPRTLPSGWTLPPALSITDLVPDASPDTPSPCRMTASFTASSAPVASTTTIEMRSHPGPDDSAAI